MSERRYFQCPECGGRPFGTVLFDTAKGIEPGNYTLRCHRDGCGWTGTWADVPRREPTAEERDAEARATQYLRETAMAEKKTLAERLIESLKQANSDMPLKQTVVRRVFVKGKPVYTRESFVAPLIEKEPTNG